MQIISADPDGEESWPNSTAGRNLFLIVKGAVSVSKTNYLQRDENAFSNTSIFGEGELVGIMEFLLGMDREKSGLVARARTEQVSKCVRLRVEG
jgi:hypothetical protein